MSEQQPPDHPDRSLPFGEADAMFEQVLTHLEASEWASAANTLRALLALMPDYPQARGLLALTEDAEQSLYPDSPQTTALQAYVHELRSDRPTAPPPPPAPLEAAGDPNNPRSWHNLPEATPSTPLPRSLAIDTQTLADSEALEATFPPLAMATILRGMLDDPHPILAYYQQTGHPAIARASGWLIGGLLWLPTLFMSLALLAGGGLPLGMSILLPILILGAWALTAWLEQNNSIGVGLVLAGCGALIVWFLAAGSLSLVGMIAGGAIALLCISTGAGMAVALLSVSIQQSIFKLASGAAGVIATAAAGLILSSITPVARGMLSTAWGGLGLALASALLAGLAGTTTYLVSFGLVAGGLFLLLYPGAFLTAFIFEGDEEMSVGPGARSGLLIMTAVLYAVLTAIMVAGSL